MVPPYAILSHTWQRGEEATSKRADATVLPSRETTTALTESECPRSPRCSPPAPPNRACRPPRRACRQRLRLRNDRRLITPCDFFFSPDRQAEIKPDSEGALHGTDTRGDNVRTTLISALADNLDEVAQWHAGIQANTLAKRQALSTMCLWTRLWLRTI
ncbi:hypothetical protein EK21DRAFT_95079 [Setomelanomma holmii]|uniref:Uncharacterized protein n=1 Tax=Setomelanomma holmii TaxID=210430 RepID=A0A9P4GWF4_9PLEO|nr:hypothetical protein EK21DRAFT_95079 [Setomelanomma holmii]